MKTLEQIAQFYNESEPLDVEELERMIEESGYVSDCHEEWGVCHSDTEKVVVNTEGIAVVCPR